MLSVLDLGEGALSPQLTFRSWTEAHKAQPRPQDACPRDEVEQGQEKNIRKTRGPFLTSPNN